MEEDKSDTEAEVGPHTVIKKRQNSVADQRKASEATARSKRKIGGSFGSAVGAKTSKQKGDWRDEVEDDPEGVAPNGNSADRGELTKTKEATKKRTPPPAVVEGDSESDVMIDPGTPLKSEDEAEQEVKPNVDTAAANAASAAPADGEAAQAAQEGAASAAQTPEAASVGAPLASSEESAAPAENGGRDLIIITLEVLMGEASIGGPIRLLLTRDFDQALDDRLVVCAAADGSPVEAIAEAACAFGGGALPKSVSRRGQAAAAVATQNGDTNSPEAGHGCAGLLSAPREGPGLVLTFGPAPALDATHEVLGRVLSGKRAIRHLQALTPCSGSSKPRLPVAVRVAGPPKSTDGKVGTEGESSASAAGAAKLLPHPVLALEAATAKDRDCQPFSWEDEPEAGPPIAQVLDVVDLEITGRDAEVAEMKIQTFGRDRQEGVIAVEDSLAGLASRLESLEGLDETMAGQRSWQTERANHLLRILKKLH